MFQQHFAQYSPGVSSRAPSVRQIGERWGDSLPRSSARTIRWMDAFYPISWTPRFFNSVTTCSQNLAPSVSATHIPRTSLTLSMVIPLFLWIVAASGGDRTMFFMPWMDTHFSLEHPLQNSLGRLLEQTVFANQLFGFWVIVVGKQTVQ